MDRLDIYDRVRRRGGTQGEEARSERGIRAAAESVAGAAGASGTAGAAQSRALLGIVDKLGGEILREGAHAVAKVEHFFPLSDIQGGELVQYLEDKRDDPLSVLFPALSSIQKRPAASELLFFDVETTGLSGGAGTQVFLAGFLKIGEKGIRVIQYFLISLSSEKLFLECVKNYLAAEDPLVSYNGKCFDYNIIRNRFIMNGVMGLAERPLHFDLLYPSRRIWKGKLSGFSLASLEGAVLNVRRTDDIPGELIPEVYARYLRGRPVERDLHRVFLHNRSDLLALPALLARQLTLVRAGFGAAGREARRASFDFNTVSLSDMFVKRDLDEEARLLLKEYLSEKKETGRQAGSEAEEFEALRRFATLCKRRGLFQDACDAFKKLSEKARELHDYVFAFTELAKLYEHRFKDFETARFYAEKAREKLEWAAVFNKPVGQLFSGMLSSILKRLERLNKKSVTR